MLWPRVKSWTPGNEVDKAFLQGQYAAITMVLGIGSENNGPKQTTNQRWTPTLKTIELRTKGIHFDAVTSSETEMEILSTPSSKAYGLYYCPVRPLKTACHVISTALAQLMNKSILCGTYPRQLKHAKVVPIHKTGDETDPSNYRPISLLSVFNRKFERLTYKRLKSFIDKNDMFFKSQYGFRKNYCTQHAILDILNKIQSNMDKKLYSCGIFIDLKKAFDTVDHTVLFASCTITELEG